MSPEASGTGEEISAGDDKEIGSVLTAAEVHQSRPPWPSGSWAPPAPTRGCDLYFPNEASPPHRLPTPITRCPPSSLTALPVSKIPGSSPNNPTVYHVQDAFRPAAQPLHPKEGPGASDPPRSKLEGTNSATAPHTSRRQQ